MQAKSLIILILSFFTLQFAYNQERHILPQDLRQETFLTEPLTLRKGFLRIEGTYSFSNGNTIYDNKGNTNNYRLTTSLNQSFNLGLRYGLTDRFQICASVPYNYDISERAEKVEYYKQNAGKNSFNLQESYMFSPRNKAIGVGDLLTEVGYQLIPMKERNFSLASYFSVRFPTGKINPENGIDYLHYSDPVGSGYYKYSLTFKFTHILYPFRYSIYADYSKYYGVKKMIRVHSIYDGTLGYEKNSDDLYLTLSGDYLINDWIGISNSVDLYSFKGTNIDDIDGEKTINYLIRDELNMNVQIKNFRLFQGFAIPLKGRNIAFSSMYILGVQFKL